MGLNGAKFQAQFHYHVLDRGIGHVYIKPATPRLNGKVERSHRIDDEDFYRMLEGVVIDDTDMFNDRPHLVKAAIRFSDWVSSSACGNLEDGLRCCQETPDLIS